MKGVRRALLSVPGVRKADVSFKRKEARVSYDPTHASVDQLIAAIQKAGFSAKVQASETEATPDPPG